MWPLGGLLVSDDSRNTRKEVCRLRSFWAQYGMCVHVTFQNLPAGTHICMKLWFLLFPCRLASVAITESAPGYFSMQQCRNWLRVWVLRNPGSAHVLTQAGPQLPQVVLKKRIAVLGCQQSCCPGCVPFPVFLVHPRVRFRSHGLA